MSKHRVFSHHLKNPNETTGLPRRLDDDALIVVADDDDPMVAHQALLPHLRRSAVAPSRCSCRVCGRV